MYNEDYQYTIETILEHILTCKKRFSKIKSEDDFISSEEGKMILDSIATRLQAIGENVKNNSRKNTFLQDNYHEIEWNNIIRFRDFISHHYEMLDYQIVFEICNDYLPKLEIAMQTELRKF